MPATPIVIAAYGTLRRGGRNSPLLAGARYLGAGRIRGRLHEISRSTSRAYPYPALHLEGSGSVVVELFELPDAAALAAVDRLEAYDPADEKGSEYIRREVAVEDGPADTAWAYVFSGPTAEIGDPIAGGDWIAHLRSLEPR